MKPALKWTIVTLAAAGCGVVLFSAAWQLEALPTGVREVVWDSQVCSECGMAVSDRRFAAQLQTTDGEICDFDDPGCLFRFLIDRKLTLHAAYFRDMQGEGWLPHTAVAFARTEQSPMAYGLGAVRPGTPDSISYDEALQRVRAADAAREHAP